MVAPRPPRRLVRAGTTRPDTPVVRWLPDPRGSVAAVRSGRRPVDESAGSARRRGVPCRKV